MPKGGERRGAGRPKGAATKKTAEIRDIAAAEGITPLEVMIRTMRERWDTNDRPGALEAANMAAPYMHPRLSAQQLEHSGSVASGGIDRPPPQSREEWLAAKRAELLAGAAAQGNAD